MNAQQVGRRRMRGFTLIELMISLVLGLLVVAAAGAIFLSNKQTYVATESLGRVQESARVAFELMARDIREAGGNPCDRHLEVANVLTDSDVYWWARWYEGILGYSAGDGPTRTAGTDALELKSAHVGVSVESHDSGTAQFVVESSDHVISNEDIALVCDFGHAAIFRADVAGNTIGHGKSASAPSNCTDGLGLPVDCSGATEYTFGKNSVIAKLNAVQWYVNENDRGGTSLYRTVLRSGSTPAVEEVVEGVSGLSIEYLVPSAAEYRTAAGVAPTEWGEVSAVRVMLDLQGEQLNAAGDVIGRQLAFVAAIRNRNQ